MAAYKALVSFAGRVSMFKGQVKELTDEATIADLTRAGYIVAIGEGAANADEGAESAPQVEKPRRRRPKTE